VGEAAPVAAAHLQAATRMVQFIINLFAAGKCFENNSYWKKALVISPASALTVKPH
jgi:hypothetical protein